MSKFSNSIQTKVFAGFMILTLAIVTLVYFILFNSEQNQKLSDAKSQIHSLSDSFTSIQRSNSIYLSNAARDYESYYRDLEVYYKVLTLDIAAVDENIKQISQTSHTLLDLSDNFLNFINASDVTEVTIAIDSTQSTWNIFRKELKEQFGDDENEPRLEWGAQYISQNSEELADQFYLLIRNFDNLALQQSELTEFLGKATVAILLAFSFLFAIFFYFQVIKPIQLAKIAFQRVSDGDFGHQIRSPRSDEIGQLIHSFNQMSARSNSVLSILSKLQNINSLNDAVELLYSQSTDYIGCDLVILVKQNLSRNGYTLNNIAPQKTFKNLYKINTPMESKVQETYMQDIFNIGATITIGNIKDYIKNNRNAVILETLINRYPLKSAILQPLDYEYDGSLLIFASYTEGRFTAQHNELLNQLIPFINNKLKSIAKLDPPHQGVPNLTEVKDRKLSSL